MVSKTNDFVHDHSMSNPLKIVNNWFCSPLFLGLLKFARYIGIVASDFQTNRNDSMGYFPSKTSFSFSDKVASEKGFWIKSWAPASRISRAGLSIE